MYMSDILQHIKQVNKIVYIKKNRNKMCKKWNVVINYIDNITIILKSKSLRI